MSEYLYMTLLHLALNAPCVASCPVALRAVGQRPTLMRSTKAFSILSKAETVMPKALAATKVESVRGNTYCTQSHSSIRPYKRRA